MRVTIIVAIFFLVAHRPAAAASVDSDELTGIWLLTRHTLHPDDLEIERVIDFDGERRAKALFATIRVIDRIRDFFADTAPNHWLVAKLPQRDEAPETPASKTTTMKLADLLRNKNAGFEIFQIASRDFAGDELTTICVQPIELKIYDSSHALLNDFEPVQLELGNDGELGLEVCMTDAEREGRATQRYQISLLTSATLVLERLDDAHQDVIERLRYQRLPAQTTTAAIF